MSFIVQAPESFRESLEDFLFLEVGVFFDGDFFLLLQILQLSFLKVPLAEALCLLLLLNSGFRFLVKAQSLKYFLYFLEYVNVLMKINRITSNLHDTCIDLDCKYS